MSSRNRRTVRRRNRRWVILIKHRETGKKILLFVREPTRDEYGLAMSYVFPGKASFVK